MDTTAGCVQWLMECRQLENRAFLQKVYSVHVPIFNQVAKGIVWTCGRTDGQTDVTEIIYICEGYMSWNTEILLTLTRSPTTPCTKTLLLFLQLFTYWCWCKLSCSLQVAFTLFLSGFACLSVCLFIFLNV